jgi:hypothetical protein
VTILSVPGTCSMCAHFSGCQIKFVSRGLAQGVLLHSDCSSMRDDITRDDLR